MDLRIAERSDGSRAWTGSDAREILRRIDEHVRAVRTKDVDLLLSSYAPGVCTFDMVEPLVNGGIEALRRRVTQWFGSFRSSIDYAIRDVVLHVAGDVAFDHHLVHVVGENMQGARIDMWFRETVGWRRQSGRWVVVHQHSSVPFDMGNGQAKLDLVP